MSKELTGVYIMFVYRLAAEQKSVLLGREYTNIKYAAEFGNIGQIVHFILALLVLV